MIDFDNGHTVETETETESDQSTEKNQTIDTLEVDTNEGEGQENGFDISNDAIGIFEDDQFIFTSEGVIDKKSLKTEDNEDNLEDSEPKTEDEKILGKFDNMDELKNSYQELQKKLGENSEAVNKLRELNPVLPMLEAMLGDDTFLEMAENYFTDPSAQADALKRQLGVDDQFVFDLNNALSDPKSEDAKILDKLMQAKQPKKTQSQQQSSQTDPQAKNKVMEKYSLSETEYDTMMNKAQNHKISHDDIYFLMNKDDIIKEERRKAKEEAQKAVKKQLQSAKSLRTNRSSSGSSSNKTASPEDAFMSSLQQGKGLFE